MTICHDPVEVVNRTIIYPRTDRNKEGCIVQSHTKQSRMLQEKNAIKVRKQKSFRGERSLVALREIGCVISRKQLILQTR